MIYPLICTAIAWVIDLAMVVFTPYVWSTESHVFFAAWLFMLVAGFACVSGLTYVYWVLRRIEKDSR